MSKPTITNVFPDTGSTAGGDYILLNGTGFLMLTALYFGPTQCTNYTIHSDTELIAVTPANAAGTIHVTVSNADGTSDQTPANIFQTVVIGGSGGDVLGSGVILRG
jgi:hypothetical protein